MNIAALEAYGVHSELLDAWQDNFGTELLPIQQKAAVDGDVLSGGSVIGSGPTGCGKTFIGEMAAASAAKRGCRTFYLVATKALAEAKYANLRRTYEPLGLNVNISTRDHRHADARIGRGDFDIAVTVPEKLWSQVMDAPQLVETTGALVIDELQLVADRQRGPRLEILLSRFARVTDVQIVGLSAVLGNGDELAQWLGAELIEEHRRPVELRKGVWRDGQFRYMEHNSGQVGIEDMPAAADRIEEFNTMVHLAVELAADGSPTIVFVPDRRSCIRAARMAADLTALPAADDETVDAMHRMPDSRSTRTLIDLFRAGVAFHNADLNFCQRQIVQKAFASGDLCCLFCTTTLALGVNLPARNVIIQPMKWVAGHGRKASLAPLSQSQFENMAGRAGRPGLCDEFGRAILCANAKFDANALMERYIGSAPEPVQSKLHALAPVQRLMLSAAFGNAPKQSENLTTLSDIRRSDDEPAWMQDAIQTAKNAGLVQASSVDGTIALTGVGRVATAAGLKAETVSLMLDAIQQLDRTPTNLEAVIIAALSTEAGQAPLPYPSSDSGGWVEHLREQAAADGAWTEFVEQLLWGDRVSATARQQAVRIALIAVQWRSRSDTSTLERQTGIHSGRALAVCDTVGWLLQSLVRMCGERLAARQRIERLQQFAESVSYAVPENCLNVCRAHVPQLQRDHAMALVDAGIDTAEKLYDASEEDLQGIVPQRVIDRVQKQQQQHQAAQARRAKTPAAHSHGDGAAQHQKTGKQSQEDDTALVIDSGRPDCARLFDTDIQLTPREFQLLSLLARNPETCVELDVIYDELWGADEIVEPQQIYWHRHNLSKKISDALPEDRDELITTLPRRGLLLELAPEQIAIQ